MLPTKRGELEPIRKAVCVCRKLIPHKAQPPADKPLVAPATPVNEIIPSSKLTDGEMTPRPSRARTMRGPAGGAGKIRAELNLEKWPGLWQPSKSKNEK